MYRFVDTLHSFIHPKEAAKNEKERRKKIRRRTQAQTRHRDTLTRGAHNYIDIN